MATCNSYEIHAIARTDIGRVRTSNEDSLFVADLTQGVRIETDGFMEFSSGPNGSFFAVADGMGGATAGEVASRVCLQALYGGVISLIQKVRKPGSEAIEQILIDAVGLANRRVLELSQSRDEYGGMGTTLTAAIQHHGSLVIGQIGDSRAYLIREDGIRQLTRDQSLVAQMVAGGQITEDQARHHAQRNILLQALGTRNTVEMGLRVVPMHADDILLLSSDGLHTQISANEVWEIVLDSGCIHEACMELINLANERGGPDNITCVLAEFLLAAGQL